MLFPPSLLPSSESGWRLPSPALQSAIYPGLVPALNRVLVPSTALRPPSPPGTPRCGMEMEAAFLPVAGSSLALAGT